MSINIVDVGVSRILGSRVDQEDRYITLNTGFLKSRKELSLFAVYDGHGGPETVNHVEQHLARHIGEEFSILKTTTPEAYQQALQVALINIDSDLNKLNLNGGSTVALALIDTKQGLLIEADLGDSHIVFADGPGPGKLTEEWNVEVLSVEHSPENPVEKKRVEQSGGHINYSTGIARIGGVSMARALGDVDYKKPRVNRLAGHNLTDLPGIETGVAPGARVTQDLVSNQAHFSVRQLNGQNLILLASDGVGNAEDAEQVTKLAVDRWKLGVSAKDIAEELTHREGKVEGADNCTVMVIILGMWGKGKRSVDGSKRMSLEVPIEGSGSRQRRRSSIVRIKDWIQS